MKAAWSQDNRRTIDYRLWDQADWFLAMVVQSLLLYGAVEPATGESFFLQFSHVDTVCFGRFLDELSQAYPDSLNIVQVDNGRFLRVRI